VSDYQALVVDFGGVLTTPLYLAMARFAEDTGIELQDLAREALGVYTGADDDLVVAYETGRIGTAEFESAFAERLSTATGVEVSPNDLVVRIFAGLEPEAAMFAAVGAARAAGLKTGLLSNSWGMALYPRAKLDEQFDVVVISGEVGLRKPDPAIFMLTTERLGVAPAQCVFVDDHPGHLQAAAEAGMATVLHRSPEQSIVELEELLGLNLSGSS
jgi:epoxide hydrolase-like predicted phosphatase